MPSPSRSVLPLKRLAFVGLFFSLAKGFSTQPKIPPSKPKATWTPEAWKGVLSDLAKETPVKQTLRVTGGAVPPDLVGILYKAGPAKFQRNGQEYKHWLEGDGAVIRLEFDPRGEVTFACRFVQTEAFRNDEQAGCTTMRGTFGTPKAQGINALDLKLKNPANTNAVRIGDTVLALSEVGLPYSLDATTLETRGLETFDGLYKDGNSAATVGNPLLDNWLGFGNALMAHTREVPLGSDTTERSSLVMAGIQQHALTDATQVDLWELDPATGQILGYQSGITLEDTGFPAHDFVCTRKYALWLTCPAEGNLLPFILGQKGPAECLAFRPGATSTLHLVTRQHGTEAILPTVQKYSLPDPIHPVHFGCAWDNPDGGVVLFLSGWDSDSMKQTMERREPLLGSWEAIQQGDFSNIQPQPLLKVTLDQEQLTVETVAGDIIEHIDFLKCHPHWEGRECQLLYGTVSTPPAPGSPSGIGPPQTICIVDLVSEEVVDTWFAGVNNILDDFILVPRAKESKDDERNAWIVAPCYKGETKTTTFVVLDASDLSKGPVCEAHLDDHHIPWALHGTWWPNH